MTYVELQLAPEAHVTESMRADVLAAVATAGLEVKGWLTVPGEPRAGDTKHPIARPTLQLVVSDGDEGDPVEAVVQHGAEIGQALALVREKVPSLPLGVIAVGAGRRRWLSFKPDETPAGILRGTAAMSAVRDLDEDAVGWSDGESRWVAL